jgi:hypothetical protein
MTKRQTQCSAPLWGFFYANRMQMKKGLPPRIEAQMKIIWKQSPLAEALEASR